MVFEVKSAYAEIHKKRGRHRKLSCEDMVLMMLEYYKEYRTLEYIGASYCLKKSNVGKTIKWVEEVLIRAGLFSLPGNKKLVQPSVEYDVIVVDTTESPIQRPKINQHHYYSGKKRHTVKYQVVIDRQSNLIISTGLFNGNAHDGRI